MKEFIFLFDITPLNLMIEKSQDEWFELASLTPSQMTLVFLIQES